MNYYLVPQAETELTGILDYRAHHSPSAALRLAEKLQLRWEMLCRFPYSSRSRDELRPGVRSVVVESIVSYFLIEDDRIAIIHILDGRRDILNMDFGKTS